MGNRTRGFLERDPDGRSPGPDRRFRSQKLVFDVQKTELPPGATTAAVRGFEEREAMPYVGSEQHPRIITLEKGGDTWVITSLTS
jgi:hypothetical protein